MSKWKFILRLFALSTFFFTLACAEKAVRPTQRMMAPVVSGGFLKGKIDGRSVATSSAVIVDDISGATPSYEPDIESGRVLGFGLDLGLLSRTDLYFHQHFVGESRYGLKWQVLGSTLQGARTGWALSLYGGFGTSLDERSSDSMISDRRGTAETGLSSWEYGLSLGHWLQPQALIYVSGGHSETKSSTKLKQVDRSSGVTLHNEKIKGEGGVDTLSLGFLLGRQIYVQGEVLYTKAHWTKKKPGDENRTQWEGTQYGVGVGYHW